MTINNTQLNQRIKERALDRVRSYDRAKKFQRMAMVKRAKSLNFMYERRRLPINYWFQGEDALKNYDTIIEACNKDGQSESAKSALKAKERYVKNGYAIYGRDLIRCMEQVQTWNTFASSLLDSYFEWGTLTEKQEQAVIRMFQKMAKRNVDEKGQTYKGVISKTEDMHNMFYNTTPTDHTEYNNQKAKACFEKNEKFTVKMVSKVFGDGWQTQVKEAS